MSPSVIFQIIAGIWSPADKAFTAVVTGEFDSLAAAKAAVKGSTDPTLAILEVRSKIVWIAAAAHAARGEVASD